MKKMQPIQGLKTNSTPLIGPKYFLHPQMFMTPPSTSIKWLLP